MPAEGVEGNEGGEEQRKVQVVWGFDVVPGTTAPGDANGKGGAGAPVLNGSQRLILGDAGGEIDGGAGEGGALAAMLIGGGGKAILGRVVGRGKDPSQRRMGGPGVFFGFGLGLGGEPAHGAFGQAAYAAFDGIAGNERFALGVQPDGTVGDAAQGETRAKVERRGDGPAGGELKVCHRPILSG